MREILFRGKRRPGCFAQEWVFGAFVPSIDGRGAFISDQNMGLVPVVPDTIGQYAEMSDKNGTKIFDGDIVAYTYRHGSARLSVKFDYGEWALFHKGTCYCALFRVPPCDIEVIGNIYDNLEVLNT